MRLTGRYVPRSARAVPLAPLHRPSAQLVVTLVVELSWVWWSAFGPFAAVLGRADASVTCISLADPAFIMGVTYQVSDTSIQIINLVAELLH